MGHSFKIRIAENTIGIHALFSDVQIMCKDYLTEGTPDFEITVTPEDISIEREKANREALFQGIAPASYPDADLEKCAVYRQIVNTLLQHDVLLFHGSVIAVDGVGYLFTAKSGTGKSTHTRLWREAFGSRAVMVNDDKPLLKIADDRVIAYGTPWAGKHHLSTNIAVPLKAICEIRRGTINEIKPVEKKTIFPMLCQQSYRPLALDSVSHLLRLIDRLGEFVQFYQLSCNMEPDAAMTAYEGMNREESSVDE